MIIVGLSLGWWTSSIERERAYRQGETLTRQVTQWVTAAHDARLAGRNEEAAALLGQAIEALRQNQVSMAEPVYVALLTDLAALELSQSDRPADTINRCDALLEEAWSLADPSDKPMRARIARERGLVEVLRGDLVQAEHWYELSAKLNPEDPVSHKRMDLLRQAKGWDTRNE